MTEEQFEQGEAIRARIKKLQYAKAYWSGEGFEPHHGVNYGEELVQSVMDEIKVLVLASLERQIAELEQKFAEL